MSDNEKDSIISDNEEEPIYSDSFEESSDKEFYSEISSIQSENEDDVVQENISIKSLNSSEKESQIGKEDQKEEHDEDVDVQIGTFYLDEENDTGIDNAKVLESDLITEKNEHEIEESESDDHTIIESIKSLNVQPDEFSTKEFSKNNIDNEHGFENCIENGFQNDIENNGSFSSNHSEIEFIVTSQTPTSFNSDNLAFHMDITPKQSRSNTSIQQRSKNSHRKSLSFSNERMREIERQNQILLRKILTQKPRKEILNQKIQCPNARITSAAINRKKQQRQIDLDNQVLKRKIEAIALRRPRNVY